MRIDDEMRDQLVRGRTNLPIGYVCNINMHREADPDRSQQTILSDYVFHVVSPTDFNISGAYSRLRVAYEKSVAAGNEIEYRVDDIEEKLLCIPLLGANNHAGLRQEFNAFLDGVHDFASAGDASDYPGINQVSILFHLAEQPSPELQQMIQEV